jgi:hypothetical protein
MIIGTVVDCPCITETLALNGSTTMDALIWEVVAA